MDNRLERRRAWIWAGVSLLLSAVAAIAYTLGVRGSRARSRCQHEAVQTGADTAGQVVYYRHGPWGFWRVLLLFWIFGGFRWMLWGPAWLPPLLPGLARRPRRLGGMASPGSTSACRARSHLTAATNQL